MYAYKLDNNIAENRIELTLGFLRLKTNISDIFKKLGGNMNWNSKPPIFLNMHDNILK